MSALTGKKAVVVGASRGFGQGIALALATAGAEVAGVARDSDALTDLASNSIQTIAGDATDPFLAGKVVAEFQPDLLILTAGAFPPHRPLHELSWDEFSVNWHTDVKMAFEWLGAALRLPLKAGSRVIVFSSGAALRGSPVSGGYAGSKATQKFITGYAQDEAQRANLDLTFTAILPSLSPATALGRSGVRAYAARNGQTEEALAASIESPLTPTIAGAAILDLATSTSPGSAYTLTGGGVELLE